MEPLHWLLITTTVTLIFVVACVSPMWAATQEAIQNSAMLQARIFVSVINILQTAPDGTTYMFDMPNDKCSVLITGNVVRLKIMSKNGQEISETIGLISTPVKITRSEFSCKDTRTLKITKKNGRMFFERG